MGIGLLRWLRYQQGNQHSAELAYLVEVEAFRGAYLSLWYVTIVAQVELLVQVGQVELVVLYSAYRCQR